MRYRELTRRLRELGCEYVRSGHGSHRIWWNPQKSLYTTIPDWGSRDLKTGLVRAILRDLDISPNEFYQDRR